MQRAKGFLAGIAAGLGLTAAFAAGYAAGAAGRTGGAIAYADRAEIEDLMVRYSHLIDDRQAEAWAATFTEDGELAFPGTRIQGRAELVAFASRPRDPRRVHFVGAPILVQVAPDRVLARSRILTTMADPASDQRKAFDGVGVYEDEIVKGPGGWRFARRYAAPDLPMKPEFIAR